MSRIIGRMRSEPRAWGRLTDTQEQLLTDQAWLVRRVRQAGTVDGTPNYLQQSWGPYAALLSNPTWSEQRDIDRFQTDVTHTLAIACDVPPLPSDLIDVEANASSITSSQNSKEILRFRVSDVQERRARFGSVMIYHLGLQLLEED